MRTQGWKNLQMATSFTTKARQARALWERGQWPDVLAFAQKWHAENPAETKPLFYQGVALAATRRFAEAEAVCRRALKMDPADFKCWNNLAALLFDAPNARLILIRRWSRRNCRRRNFDEPVGKIFNHGWARINTD